MITKEMTQMLVNTTATHKVEIEAIFEEAKQTLKKIVLTENHLEKLIYQVTILANDTMYFFLKDGQIAYHGMVDSEGTYQTIQQDIAETHAFINAQMLMFLGDVDKLHTFFSSGNNLMLYSIQAMKGFTKGHENGHY